MLGHSVWTAHMSITNARHFYLELPIYVSCCNFTVFCSTIQYKIIVEDECNIAFHVLNLQNPISVNQSKP